MFPEDQTVPVNVQVVTTSYNSHEDHASDILRCHYGTLSQSLQYPIRLADTILWRGSHIRNNTVCCEE